MMKLVLFKNVPLSSAKRPCGSVHKDFKWNSTDFRAVSNAPTTNEEKLVKWLQSQGQDDLHEKVQLSLILPPAIGGRVQPGIKLAVESSLLTELHSEIHQGNDEEKLNLTLSIQAGDGKEIKSVVLKPKTTFASGEATLLAFHHIRYEAFGVKMPKEWLVTKDNQPWQVQFGLQLEVADHDYFPIQGLLPHALSMNRLMMRNSALHDLTLILKNGEKVHCNTLFLCSYSRKIYNMVFGACTRTRQRKAKGKNAHGFSYVKPRRSIELVDVSKNCFLAILEFIYCRVMTQFKRESKLTMEVLQTAVQLEIEPLKICLLKLLLTRKYSWYDLDGSLYLYLFLRTSTSKELVGLKNRILTVIHAFKGQLPNSVLKSDKRFSRDVWLEIVTYVPSAPA